MVSSLSMLNATAMSCALPSVRELPESPVENIVVLISCSPGTMDRVASHLEANRGRIFRKSEYRHVLTAKLPAQALAGLRRLPEVRAIEQEEYIALDL